MVSAGGYGLEFALRTQLRWLTTRGRVELVAATLIATMAVLTPQAASAEGLFDFLFGGMLQQPQRAAPPGSANFFADPFGLQAAPTAPRPGVNTGSGRYAAFCVRTCDGKYFPLSIRNGITPAQMCQSLCPAAPTKVFSGSSIDGATTSNGERYADSSNAYAYRKALKADCTCNGRNPAGLAPVDLSQDPSLRPGDVVATADGLVAYTGVRLGADQTPDFAPVADYPGLTTSVRAKLGEMKVAPINAEMIRDEASPAATRATVLPASAAQAASSPKARRTVVN